MTQEQDPTSRRKFLRRALWQSRETMARAHKPFAALAPEEDANLLLRQYARQSVKEISQPTQVAGCAIYTMPDDWRCDVLRSDPCVARAYSRETLRTYLKDPYFLEVLASGDVRLDLQDIQNILPPGGPEKTLFLHAESSEIE